MNMPTQPPGRRNTGKQMPAAGARKTTGPQRAIAAPAAKKNNLPLILGGAGAGVLLIILLVAMGGSGTEGASKKKDTSSTAPAADKPKPDVSALENEGKKKCDDGAKVCESKLPKLSGAASDEKEKVRREIEAGLKSLNEGLAAYKKAKDLAGKTYDLSWYERVRAGTLKHWSADVEKEALGSCDEALKMVVGLEALMTKETSQLTPQEKTTLVEGLQKAKKLHEHGMELCNRSQEFTGHGFDVSRYGSAYKALKMKLLELK